MKISKRKQLKIAKQNCTKHLPKKDNTSYRFDRLEGKMDVFEGQIKTIQSDMGIMRKDISVLQSDVYDIKGDMHTMQKIMQHLLENDQKILDTQDFIIGKLTKMEQEQIFGFRRVDHHEVRINTLEKHMGFKTKEIRRGL